MALTLNVAKLRISDAVAAKIEDEHGLDPDKLRASIEGVGNLPFRWGRHPVTMVLRALLVAEIDDEACLVVLYPALGHPADVWNLGSAYPIESD